MFTGDFNAHSVLVVRWKNNLCRKRNRKFNFLLNYPSSFEPYKNLSWIDLIITDQPNLILDCGTRASLDSFCHHQIIYCRVNFRIPPRFERKTWHFSRANIAAIKRSIVRFPWHIHLSLPVGIGINTKTFTKMFLNIMSNFIPNEIKTFVPRDPPWISKKLETMLNRKNRFIKNYKRKDYKEEDKVRLDLFRTECQKAVEPAKVSYLRNMGNKLKNPGTSQKSYWKIIHRVMNKCGSLKIPPLRENDKFILDFGEKAKYFNEFFLSTMYINSILININNSILNLTFLTGNRINHIAVGNGEILSLTRNLNPNKATGSDGISGQMLLLWEE